MHMCKCLCLCEHSRFLGAYECSLDPKCLYFLSSNSAGSFVPELLIATKTHMLLTAVTSQQRCSILNGSASEAGKSLGWAEEKEEIEGI